MDEEHAKRVHGEGAKDYLINIGDELITIDPQIAQRILISLHLFNVGSNLFKHVHKGNTIRVYVWHDTRQRQIYLGTRKDVVNDIGEEETKKIDDMYKEKFGEF